MGNNRFDHEKDIIIEPEYFDTLDRGSVRGNVSPAVIKRLPRYFRYLRKQSMPQPGEGYFLSS